MLQAQLVDAFEQAGSEFSMNLNSRSNNFPREWVALFHFSFSFISLLCASVSLWFNFCPNRAIGALSDAKTHAPGLAPRYRDAPAPRFPAGAGALVPRAPV